MKMIKQGNSLCFHNQKQNLGLFLEVLNEKTILSMATGNGVYEYDLNDIEIMALYSELGLIIKSKLEEGSANDDTF
ncbi:MAG: hypothetical protein ACTTIS_00065 [Streptobacillus sp.]